MLQLKDRPRAGPEDFTETVAGREDELCLTSCTHRRRLEGGNDDVLDADAAQPGAVFTCCQPGPVQDRVVGDVELAVPAAGELKAGARQVVGLQ